MGVDWGCARDLGCLRTSLRRRGHGDQSQDSGQTQDSHMDDRNEYMTYITRCAQRMQSLGVK